MAEDKKRFWWLKLKEGYFDSEGMRRLRKQAGGEVFTIIYLKCSLQACARMGLSPITDMMNRLQKKSPLPLVKMPTTSQMQS